MDGRERAPLHRHRLGRRARAALAIDLGTAYLRIATPSDGVVLDEPCLVALDAGGRLLCAGRDAVRLARQAPEGCRFVRPLGDGVIADLDATVQLLGWALRRLQLRSARRTRTAVSVPVGATPLERRAVHRALASAGFDRPPMLVDEPLAAAMGLELPVADEDGCLVVDIGAGITESAVVANGGIMGFGSARVGCQALLREARAAAARNRVPESDRTGWDVLALAMAGGGSSAGAEARQRAVGVDVVNRRPAAEARRTLAPVLDLMVGTVSEALDAAPPSLAAQVVAGGLHLVGGGATVPDLPRHLEERLRLPVRVGRDPLHAVSLGDRRCLEPVRVA
jgi:rod shape-determining protein MreB